MKSIEEVIDNIVDEHKECRWMDASELREYLEVVAKEQKVLDVEKACRIQCSMCPVKCEIKDIHEATCTEIQYIIEAMEE